MKSIKLSNIHIMFNIGNMKFMISSTSESIDIDTDIIRQEDKSLK